MNTCNVVFYKQKTEPFVSSHPQWTDYQLPTSHILRDIIWHCISNSFLLIDIIWHCIVNSNLYVKRTLWNSSRIMMNGNWNINTLASLPLKWTTLRFGLNCFWEVPTRSETQMATRSDFPDGKCAHVGAFCPSVYTMLFLLFSDSSKIVLKYFVSRSAFVGVQH